jgi:hypothetical protein
MLSAYRPPPALRGLLVLDSVIHSVQILIPIPRKKLSGQHRGSDVDYLVILDLVIHSIPHLRLKRTLIDFLLLNRRSPKRLRRRLLRTIQTTHLNRGIRLLSPFLGPHTLFRHLLRPRRWRPDHQCWVI